MLYPVEKIREVSLIDKLNMIFTKIEKIDFEKISNNLNRFIFDADISLREVSNNLNKVINNFNYLVENNETKTLPKNLNKTLLEIQKLSKSYNNRSILYIKLNEILKNINKSILLFEKIEKKIDNKPNALIFGD
ncbi:hypothetical protein [Caminibacter mediatlanticus]|uniref:Uncharacterized protein n=1 Tax=Caminibacter mediatlanticus TB-2 TaxID=391592 RepID=A0AAI9AI69_9BACT|nr:hypothetical protein [Caminibacter mediatlanticus]EDM23962.1 hypothetical protein CMTB2_06901 [Caminibacter mediatlanticus TB-2]